MQGDHTYRQIDTWEMAVKYANGIKAYAAAIVDRWNDGNRPERRRILAALRRADGPAVPDLLKVLPREIVTKL